MNGKCYNDNLAFCRSATYKVFCTDAATAATEVLATITGANVSPSYVHSFFLTENYVSPCIWTAHFASMGLATLRERNLLDDISPFNKNATTHWFVMDRRGIKGSTAAFHKRIDVLFPYNQVFEEKQANGSVDVLADPIEYPSLDVFHRLYHDNLVSNVKGARMYQPDDSSELDSTVASMARYRFSGLETR